MSAVGPARGGTGVGGADPIAEAGPDALAELADLWVAAWRATLTDIDFDARRPWFLSNCEARARAGARIFVLRRGGVPAGFVLIDPETGYLDQIAVAPQWRGKGVAARLLDAAKAISPRGVDLDVNEENPRAVAFYRKQAFAVTGRGRNPTSGRPVFNMRWRP